MKHHATLYITPQFDTIVLPREAAESSADVLHCNFDSLGIAEARQLARDASIRPVHGEKRRLVVFAATITVEAQNALLKLFEDPPETSEFYLLVPRESTLLATLRSRLQLAEAATVIPASDTAFKEFQELSYQDRLAVVAEKIKAKDTAWVDGMHAGVANYAGMAVNLNAAVKKELLFIETNLRRRGGSKKMLLEALALTLPVGA